MIITKNINRKKHKLFQKLRAGVFIAAVAVATSVGASESPPVLNVYITGNERVPAADIIPHITFIRKGDAVDEKLIRADVDHILSMGVFDEVKARIVPVAGGCLVFFDLTEAAPVKSVNVDSPVPVGNLSIAAGDLVNSQAVKAQAEAINKSLLEKGALASVSNVSVTPQGDIQFTVEQKKINSILFTGLKHTKDWVARKLISPLKEGDSPKKSDLEAAAKRLYDSGYFKNVSIRVEQGMKPSDAIVVFDLVEDYMAEWRLGGGYNSRTGGIFTGGVKNINIGGEGKTLAVSLSLNGANSTYDIRYTDPYYKRSDNSLSLGAWKSNYSGKQDNLEYSESRSGGSIEYAKTLTKNPSLQFIRGFRSENESVTKDGVASNSSLRVLSLGMAFSSVDSKQNPTKGHSWITRLDEGVRILGGTTSFSKLYSELKSYKQTGAKSVIATRINVQAGSSSTPLGEQFSLGGDGAVRGIPDGNNKGTGGGSISIEYRYRISEKVEAAIFTDAGKTWGTPTSSTAVGGGVGIRFQTPMGLLRFDFAKTGNSPWQTIFGFGRSF